MRVSDELWPLIIKAVADKRFSKRGEDGLFADMLASRIADNDSTVIEQEVDKNGNVQAMLASPKMTGGHCERCGKPVFGWSSLCDECKKEKKDGVR